MNAPAVETFVGYSGTKVALGFLRRAAFVPLMLHWKVRSTDYKVTTTYVVTN
jgi:hypothetical protein